MRSRSSHADCDFIPGEGDGHVLCEINVGSVSPFPPPAIPALVAAIEQRITTG